MGRFYMLGNDGGGGAERNGFVGLQKEFFVVLPWPWPFFCVGRFVEFSECFVERKKRMSGK